MKENQIMTQKLQRDFVRVKSEYVVKVAATYK